MFITIEGIEGSGKSTLIQSLSRELAQDFAEIIATYEPGATTIGKFIRSILLNTHSCHLAPESELLLFGADRAQHIAEVITPALARGALVICDRYVHSTIAYQGYGRGLSLENLQTVNTLATSGLLPDLVLLLDIDPTIGLDRAKKRTESTTPHSIDNVNADSWTRFEQEKLEFHHRIRAGFLHLAKEDKERFMIIDAQKPTAEISLLALKEIRSRINTKPVQGAARC